MQYTTPCDPGTVVAVEVRFTAGSGSKPRPAVIMTDAAYHASRNDAIIIPLTSNRTTIYHGDHIVQDWQTSGLLTESKAKCNPETIDRKSIKSVIGTLSQRDLTAIRQQLRTVLSL